jgi:hypothetical protein
MIEAERTPEPSATGMIRYIEKNSPYWVSNR